MKPSRRRFLQSSALAAGAAAAGCGSPTTAPTGQAPAPPTGASSVHPAIAALAPMTAGIVPIADGERQARIEKARTLMAAQKVDALVMEGGSSMFYFTGTRWGLSERPFVLVLPQKGELAYVTPGFEESRTREVTKFTSDIRVWQEDESPYAVIAGVLKDRGLATGRIALEERLRFFVADGLRAEAPRASFVLGTPITAGCRMLKSPAEIALMQRASDITIEAFRAAHQTLREGMTEADFRRNIEAAFAALGAQGSALVLFGQWSALPHGTINPQQLKEGDVVLFDGGTSIEGYQSDITRTTVFGTPTQRQRDVWELEKRAQTAGFEAARIGAPCEAVDAAARKVIVDAGFGPDYATPGLPHRTGHGIGLDGHEWTNFVRGNTTPLAPGMCFSDEPMIAIPGEFGIRLEDCLYMTEAGPRFFSEQSPAVDRPFGTTKT
jgi:Xaa-Pro dipeptidase